MNVYDFDETIYDGDSTRDFYFYCLKKNKSILKFLPKQGYHFLKFALGIINKTKFKEKFYVFLTALSDVDSEVADFWKEHYSNIKPWYFEQKRADDVIISASPEFLLKPVSEKLGFTLMASRINKNTGECFGENCYGEEKVLRYKEFYDVNEIEQFYSDSLSDSPLARLSKEAFIVAGNDFIPWDSYAKSHKK